MRGAFGLLLWFIQMTVALLFSAWLATAAGFGFVANRAVASAEPR